MEHDKTYIATLKLGEKTDTGDSEGQVIEEKSIPKTMIDILLSIHAFSTDKLYISNECETYKLIANGLLQAIICNIHIERYKKGEFDVEINNKIICFDVNKPDIKSILKEVSKVGF